MKQKGLLAPYLVLDLSENPAALCAKLLGDLGANVIKIEKPGGDPSRSTGPFVGNQVSPEKSLSWYSNNTSKKDITLDIEMPEGRDLFKKLVKSADFIIETFSPGYLENLRLDYAVLKELNQRVIMTSITPFGQTGPYAHYQSCDLVTMGMGGMMHLIGYSERAPLRYSIEQSFSQAGAQAAVATLMAHYYRQKTGHGQHVDVSIQESVLQGTFLAQHHWDVTKTLLKRGGIGQKRGPVFIQFVFPCKDGFILWGLIVAHQGAKTRALVEWLEEEDMAGDMVDIDWEKMNQDEIDQEQLNSWTKLFSAFFLNHTKDELYKGAIQRGILLMPICNYEELYHNAQLEYRDFWQEVEHPDLGRTINYPGVPFKSSALEFKMGRPPLIGEHNDEIYRDLLHLSQKELNRLRENHVI